jgi:hypothetical protein
MSAPVNKYVTSSSKFWLKHVINGCSVCSSSEEKRDFLLKQEIENKRRITISTPQRKKSQLRHLEKCAHSLAFNSAFEQLIVF